MRPYLLGALLGALAVAAIGFGLLFALNLELAEDGDAGTDGITVPEVIGMPVEDAEAEVEATGLDANVVGGGASNPFLPPLDPTTPVAEQTPEGGSEVPLSATVTLTPEG